MKPLYWTVVNTIYVLLKVFYRIEIRGAENIPDGPAIIAPNHISYLDPPIIGSSSPKELHYLANARLFKKTFLGPFIRRVNAHPVNPQAADTTALKTVLNLLGKGHRVLIFPEGSRSKDGELQPLKLGAAMLSLNSGCPIIPTYIQGAYEIWPRTSSRPKRSGKLIVTFGKAIDPKDFQGSSKKETQQLITEAIQDYFIKMSKKKK